MNKQRNPHINLLDVRFALTWGKTPPRVHLHTVTRLVTKHRAFTGWIEDQPTLIEELAAVGVHPDEDGAYITEDVLHGLHTRARQLTHGIT